MQYKDINDYEVLYLIGENQLEEKDIKNQIKKNEKKRI